MRPRRPGIARILSERERAAQAPPDPAEAEAAMSALGLGGLFDGLRTLAETFGKLGQGGERSFDIGGKPGRVVFGYSVRTGLDGARAEPFGDVPEPGQPPAEAARQPIVDVFEEADAIVVVAEIPGAAEADIACRVDGNRLLIQAGGARRYRKQVALPVPVVADSLRHSLRNGILEIRLARPPAAP